jgi:predicted transcriptional regulator
MTVKIAISLSSSLVEKVESLTRELNISQNQLFSNAVEEFIERHETKRMSAAINEAYKDSPDEEDRAIQREIQEYHRKLMRDEEW